MPHKCMMCSLSYLERNHHILINKLSILKRHRDESAADLRRSNNCALCYKYYATLRHLILYGCEYMEIKNKLHYRDHDFEEKIVLI